MEEKLTGYSTASKGLLIGGKSGDTENALNYDIDGVTFNNIVETATGSGDRTNGQGSIWLIHLICAKSS